MEIFVDTAVDTAVKGVIGVLGFLGFTRILGILGVCEVLHLESGAIGLLADGPDGLEQLRPTDVHGPLPRWTCRSQKEAIKNKNNRII